MKNIMFLLAMPMMFVFVACSSSSEELIVPTEKSEVSFVLDFTFIEGGSMSRANADVYKDFYDNNIKNKKLIPDNYEISFTNQETNIRYDFKGNWSQKDKITLLEGTYKVNGASWTNEMCSDKASISFTTDVTIEKGMTELVVKAGYACCLLMFNKSNINKLQFRYSDKIVDLFTYGDYYYCFGVNISGNSSNSSYFDGERDNGSTFTLRIGDGVFENGKYYFFNDVASSFDIPEMEAGN